ncbi:MAG TPA: hypothetical protein VF493_06155 [Terriglobales bacterium]
MYKKILLGVLAAVSVAWSQDNPAPSTKELLSRDKVFFVESGTFYVKKEEIEKGLLKRKEFEKWGLQVSQLRNEADLILLVKRAPFQNNFPYTVTDRRTGIVVLGGEVNSLGGTVPGKIAGQIVDKLKKVYEPKIPKTPVSKVFNPRCEAGYIAANA